MSDPEKNSLSQFLEGTDRADYEETPDITKAHGALAREHQEPAWQSAPVPMWLGVLCAVAAFVAGGYLLLFHGGFRSDVFNERQTSPDLLFPQATKGGEAGAVAVVEDPKEIGRKAFSQNCASCHQATGSGVAGQYPPLAKSEWVGGTPKRLALILLKGLQGPVHVEGAVYNGAMPAWEKTLTDKKIAAILTYVRSDWGNNAPEITPEQIGAARKLFAAKTDSASEAELLAIPADAILEGGPAPGAADAGKTGTPAKPGP